MRSEWFKRVLIIFQFFSCLIWTNVQGHFNLYLSPGEMKRILGLSKELYYVREGVVNEYALNFIVTVPAHVNTLHFTWQALGKKRLPYSSSIESSESLAMKRPTLSIPSSGLIPTDPQTFQLRLPCTGELSDEVQLKLTLNVSSFVSSRTVSNSTVTLRRKKICLEDPNFKLTHRMPKLGSRHLDIASVIQQPTTVILTNGSDNDNQNINAPAENETDSGLGLLSPEDVSNEVFPDNSVVLFVVVGCSLGLVGILIVGASSSVAIFRRRKVHTSSGFESSDFLNVGTNGNSSSSSGSGSGFTFGGSIFLRPESPHHYSTVTVVSPCPRQLDSDRDRDCNLAYDSDIYTYSTFQRPEYKYNSPDTFYAEISGFNKNNSQGTLSTTTTTSSTVMDYSTFTTGKLAEKLTIPRCKVRLQSVIMEGTFGKIYNGSVLQRDGSERNVIVKTVTDHSSHAVQMTLLLHEGLSLVGMVHEHVLGVMGIAAEERVPPFLIYPDEGFRNLKRFLQTSRSGPGRQITTEEIAHMASQVANGMAYLHRQGVIHGDVATRNCVVDDKLRVKVSDSGLSKDLFPEDYHKLVATAERRPVKWMSPETIIKANVYVASPQTDMWSFGILLWELATLAQQPYPEIKFGDVLPFLRMGYRLSRPINCPDELYSSMTRCWAWEAEDRPKWHFILSELHTLHSQLTLYI